MNASVRKPLAHDSAKKHVSGEAIYVDDIIEPRGTLHLYAAMASEAHARLLELDVDAVSRAPGVACVLTANDIPGVNDISPTGTMDEPLLADETVVFHGQPLFVVAAETIAQARAAAALAKVRYEALPAILTVDDALKAESYVAPPYTMRRGDPEQAMAGALYRLSGSMRIGGQDHFYLEGQASLAVPQEDGDVTIHCSTQHPSEVQTGVAHVLGRSSSAVTVEVRRMGGGFGGKETQAAQWAALAALVAVRTGRAAKMRLDRDDDMIMTGKRHDFLARYEVGFDEQGMVQALDVMLASRCGHSADLSAAINDRAMFHIDNGYYLPNVEVRSFRCRTNTVSNTAFRGFGGPQGMLVIERIMKEVAHYLGEEPLEVRRRNFYGVGGRDTTHYGMVVEDNVLPQLVDELVESSQYYERQAAIQAFNRASPIIKRGIALTPVKFGISFTTTFLNQAGALIHLYADGSVHLNHGGTEMGQGLFIKIAQIVADELSVPLDSVKITATSTGKVPNTSPTAASSGTDMNGMAARNAARTLRLRLIAHAAERFGVAESEISFDAGTVLVGGETMSFADLVKSAYLARVQLSATGFYKTPKINFDRETGQGRPFLYFAYGAAVSEVAIDTLTGETRLLRTDILHDVGRSLNPAIDLGQIEGGYIQGVGWLTSEELFYDDDGRLRTHAPSTYKIPTCSDRPDDFRMAIWEPGENREDTIHKSKAVGEPPLMLGMSAFFAIANAVSAAGSGRIFTDLDAPATPERVLMAIERQRSLADDDGSADVVGAAAQ